MPWWHPPKTQLTERGAENVAGAVTGSRIEPPRSKLHRTFLIFGPWCDQGLGIQSRAYVYWLRKLGHDVVVFACRSSKSPPAGSPKKSSPHNLQADPAEWGGVKVIYDPSNREEVPYERVIAAVQSHGATDALMLETAHRNIFVISGALSQCGVRVFAVPNIELVRRQEVPLYSARGFHRILCSSKYTQNVLAFFKVPEKKARLFPFALEDASARAKPHVRGEVVRFLLVGGMNACRRKQADKVIAAFCQAFDLRKGEATLTVLCQGQDAPRDPRRADVAVITDFLSHRDIEAAYAASHVVLMMSRAEGIGIGQHEAMRAGCAILALKTPMFQELVNPEINGWLVPSIVEDAKTGAKMIGNDDPIVQTFTFDVGALVAAMRLVVESDDIGIRQKQSRAAHDLLFREDRVIEAYTHALDPVE